MKFALAAILTGQFVMQEAIGNFFVMAIMGALVGIVVAFLHMLISEYCQQLLISILFLH
jgi:CPA1 family monovalent cation:H+ antiporter